MVQNNLNWTIFRYINTPKTLIKTFSLFWTIKIMNHFVGWKILIVFRYSCRNAFVHPRCYLHHLAFILFSSSDFHTWPLMTLHFPCHFSIGAAALWSERHFVWGRWDLPPRLQNAVHMHGEFSLYILPFINISSEKFTQVLSVDMNFINRLK